MNASLIILRQPILKLRILNPRSQPLLPHLHTHRRIKIGPCTGRTAHPTVRAVLDRLLEDLREGVVVEFVSVGGRVEELLNVEGQLELLPHDVYQDGFLDAAAVVGVAAQRDERVY
jgi:hypothetical protein